MSFRFLIVACFICSMTFAQKGTITGVLTDKDANNATLPFANAMIKGTNIGATTDENGKYVIGIEPGNYTIVFSFLGYDNVESQVTVVAGETVTINKALGSGSYKLDDVVIQAAAGGRERESALLLDQKKAVEIKQSIGAQEMSRKGVSDVEEGLTKVTGISKVESRGLFVRGLEDRYNNLLINDLQAPSNTPFNKIIPLDLFPTDIVGVLNIYKTFNPNISGDFAGATINIETAQPRASITKIGTSFGFTTANNGNDFLISQDANNTQGFLGFLEKDRRLPALYGKIPQGKSTSAAQYKESSAQNSWNVDNTSAPINSGFNILHAEKFNLKNEKNISYLFSFNGDNNYQVRKGLDRTFNQGQGNYDNNLFTKKYSYTTSFSGLGSVKYKSKRFGVAVNSFLLRSTISAINDQLGYTNSLTTNPNILIRTNQFDESKYWNNQILANYSLTEDERHTVKGGFSFVKTSYQQPDRKILTGEKVSETDIKTTYGGNNLIRQFLDITGDRYVSGLFEYNLKLGERPSGKSNRISVGYNTFTNEEVSTYRFVFGKPLISTSYIVSINDIDPKISSDVESGLLKFTEESTGTYKSKLFQTVHAGYANAFLNFGSKVEINGGARIESFTREIKSRGISASFTEKYDVLTKEKLYILPSINVKYAVTESKNIRFAASQTFTKPVSMEVLPIEYVNPDATVIRGNPNLVNSDNINVDLKFEMFPNSKELIAVGVFGKQIQNPIERIFIPTASSGGQILTFDNSKEAIIYGIEIEALLQASRIAAGLKNFSFGFNASLMKTDVEVDLEKNPLENDSKRALQGAAEWVINSDLKYDFQFNQDMKNTISLVYGVSGDRIYAVGTAGLDHIYEKPFHKLDFVWSSNLSKNINVKLAAENLLNPTFSRELGSESTVNITESDLTVKEFKRGTAFSLGINYTF